MSLKETIEKTKAGDVDAFTILVQRYQNLALAYAFSILKDFQQAQDVVQEAFIIAFYQIAQLQDPEAFPGWIKGVVRNQCYRQLRSKANRWESLEVIEEVADENLGLDLKLSQQEESLALLQAVNSLPEHQREVVSLFYIEENSQADVAAFLEMSVSDVNNCLHAARKTLKRRMEHMVDQTMKSKALPKDFAEDIGKIIKVQGNLVDVEIGSSFAPALFDDLKTGKKRESKITVIQRLTGGRLRCLIHGDTKGLEANTKLKNETEPSFSSLEEGSIKEVISKIGTASSGKKEIFETGIKVIDLLCPFPKEGNIGMIGGTGVGRLALVSEMFKKLVKDTGRLSIFYFVTPIDAGSVRAMVERESDLTSDERGPMQTAWLITRNAADPELAEKADYLDARPFFSPVMAVQAKFPAVDPLLSHSKLLDPAVVGNEHDQVAKDVRDLIKKEEELMKDSVFFEYLAVGAKQKAKERAESFETERFQKLSKDEQLIVSRARKLKNFFTQPFFVAEDYTKVKGVSVPLQKTIETCKMIISGELDDLPVRAFHYCGDLDDVRKKARE